MLNLSDYIRDIKDFPKQGIIFKDITTLLQDKNAFEHSMELLYQHYKNEKIDKVVGIESRGFIGGAVLAYKLGAGFVPVRKKGKLPSDVLQQEYQLEYGTSAVEIHVDSIAKGERVLIHDDVLATGGTAEATCQLVEKLGGKIIGLSFIIELSFLHPQKKNSHHNIFSLLQYK